MPFLDPATLAKLETLQLKARVVAEGAITGLHRARQHGSSVEFAEHKEYSPGDEIRHIDWKVYAKADRYYVKRFEQESELCTYLLLDASGSMAYRGRGIAKLEYASYLVAALAHLIIRQRDKAGLMVFGDDALERYVPPRARPAHLHDLLAVLEDTNARGAHGAEAIAPALERIAELARRRRSLVVLVSDLFDREHRVLDVLRRLRSRRHDVAVFHVLDEDELELPFDGLTVFESLEENRRLVANPSAIRREYRRRMDEFLRAARTACVEGGIDYQLVPTAQPLERSLLDFLSTRTRTGATRVRPWSS